MLPFRGAGNDAPYGSLAVAAAASSSSGSEYSFVGRASAKDYEIGNLMKFDQ
jgi:hypothetical protein